MHIYWKGLNKQGAVTQILRQHITTTKPLDQPGSANKLGGTGNQEQTKTGKAQQPQSHCTAHLVLDSINLGGTSLYTSKTRHSELYKNFL